MRSDDQFSIELIGRDKATDFRTIRLSALTFAPEAFGVIYEEIHRESPRERESGT